MTYAEKAFLDWFNNYLSHSCFADSYDLSDVQAWLLLADGRDAHYTRHGINV